MTIRDSPAAVDLVDLTQCKYCYKDFDAQDKMQEHCDQIHLMKVRVSNLRAFPRGLFDPR